MVSLSVIQIEETLMQTNMTCGCKTMLSRANRRLAVKVIVQSDTKKFNLTIFSNVYSYEEQKAETLQECLTVVIKTNVPNNKRMKIKIVRSET